MINNSVTGYLPLIQKVSLTQIHGLAVYVKERLSFAWDVISRKLYRFFLT